MTAQNVNGQRDEIVERAFHFFAIGQAREAKNASVLADEVDYSPGLWEPVASSVDGSASDRP